MKIAIAGCLGRMGQTLLQYVNAQDNLQLVGGTILANQAEEAEKLKLKLDLPQDIIFSDNLPQIMAIADAIIDFTSPEYSLQIAEITAKTGKIHICGTTGFSEDELKIFKNHGDNARIVHAPNMSICVNLFMKLTEQTASILGDEFDIEISEMHHRFKADSPSGTALDLGRAAAAGRGVSLDDVADRGRDGITGKRKAGNIGFSALRGGDVVGDHTVTFAGMGERLELTHKASSREIYASGAVKAAIWAKDQPAGYYSMYDVLGL